MPKSNEASLVTSAALLHLTRKDYNYQWCGTHTTISFPQWVRVS
jgi:hypothetical protein